LATAALATALLLGGMATRGAASPPEGGPLPSCTVACISVGDASLLEGDSGQRVVPFVVTLSQAVGSTVTVQYRIVAGSAFGASKVGAGVDFNNKAGKVGTLTFLAGAVSRPVTVLAYGDTTVEGNERFRVVLSNPTGGARLARPLALGTIIDDDGAGSDIHVGVGDAAVAEGDSRLGRVLGFPVTLSSPSTTSVTLNYAVSGVDATWSKTAVPGGDFGGKVAGVVKFVVGTRGTTPVLTKISIPVWPDSELETPDQTLTLTISAVTLPAGVSITRPTGTGAIVDDDAPPTTVPVPSSMAALGDSITKAFNACTNFGECAAASWATGTDALVDSHYSRIVAVNPAMVGNGHNDAVSGATMSNLNGQATNAVAQGVDYVTIEMGGNDVCKPSEAEMTPVSTYQAQFEAAMTTLTNGLPNAHIFVASIPDVYRLWFVAKDNQNARNIWSTFGICQSMTANPLSTEPADVDRRDRVRQRNIDFNTALATVCAEYVNCRFDGNFVFNQQFDVSDVSSTDYFHPSFSGQTALAIGTYAVGWNW
jgi:lysophospholipase L1-like esterase